MRIGIDCDGVLRDFIPCLIDDIKETHPEHSDKILVPKSWDWETWLPFWTEEETEKYVFAAVEDWPILKTWAMRNGHELVLVSAQREHCIEPTNAWLEKYGFDFKEKHYTQDKWSIDVDVLIDDSPAKLKKFKERSVSYGVPICMNQTWNKNVRDKYMNIDRLSDILTTIFG